MNKKNNEIINLFWTGGWDSTYELLNLLLIHKKTVQPFYLIDAKRPSLRAEIKTMNLLKSEINSGFPHTDELLLTTKYFSISDIPENPKLSDSYNNIRARTFIGEQYEWLARFCVWKEVSEIELAIHIDDTAHKAIKGCTELLKDDHRKFFKLNPSCDVHLKNIFQYYSFPILDMSKIDMKEMSEEKGWNEMMFNTWFCHKPTKNMKPCGLCNPCKYTVDEGLGLRVSMGRKNIGKVIRFAVQLKNRILN